MISKREEEEARLAEALPRRRSDAEVQAYKDGYAAAMQRYLDGMDLLLDSVEGAPSDPAVLVLGLKKMHQRMRAAHLAVEAA